MKFVRSCQKIVTQLPVYLFVESMILLLLKESDKKKLNKNEKKMTQTKKFGLNRASFILFFSLNRYLRFNNLFRNNLISYLYTKSE